MSTVAAIAVASIALGGLAACAPAQTESVSQPLVLVTHDSFNLSEGILDQFTEETGIEVTVQASGDAGQVVNTLVLTKDSPLGDVVFGIDNTFASRAVDAGVLEDYVSGDLTDAESDYLLPAGQGGEQLTPITNGDVCVNVDHEWFTEAGIAEPVTLEDLTNPEYKDLLVVEAANTSSPGLAFLLSTIGAFGEDGWQQYWSDLMANGTLVVAGLLVATVGSYIGRDLHRTRGDAALGGIAVVVVLWAATGAALAAVGLLPLHRSPIPHDIAAFATLVLFAAAATATVAAVPRRPRILVLTSVGVGLLAVVALILWMPFGLYAVTAVEAVLVGLGLLWMATLVRVLGILVPAQSRPSARRTLLRAG